MPADLLRADLVERQAAARSRTTRNSRGSSKRAIGAATGSSPRSPPALEFLERSFARGWGKRDWIEHDPDYEILRGDPRFERLLAKLK